MNAGVRLAYIASHTPMTRFAELDCVRLLSSVCDMDGQLVEAGTLGAVVSINGAGESYEVEFVEPLQALATVRAEDLELDPTAA